MSPSHRAGHAVASLLIAFAAYAQPPAQDPAYVRDLSQRLTVRLYGSHKYNSMLVRAQEPFDDLRYRPNGQVNIGLGASYRRLTLNIGVKMPFVNDDNEEKGRTRFLDAQAHMYGPKQASNLFLQVYKGYHITSHSWDRTGWTGDTDLPYRADLLQYNIGISSLRVLNSDRFSYRAAFNQDAVQLISQGSWLVGAYATCYMLRADSAIVPDTLAMQFPLTAGVDRGTFIDAGPIGGYAYTHVFGDHLFVTGSGAVGVGISGQFLRGPKEEGFTHTKEVGPGWHVQFRVAVGYNSRTRYAGVYFDQENIGYLLRDQQRFAWNVGVVRVVLAQRFLEKPKAIERSTRWLDRKKKEVLGK